MNPLRILALLLAVAAGAPADAQPNTHVNRADAIRGLTAPDPAHRVDAVVWIAANGNAADERLLRPRLADESAMVRELAERGLWILWNRSGDPAIDALMEKGRRAGAGAPAGGGDLPLTRKSSGASRVSPKAGIGARPRTSSRATSSALWPTAIR